MRTKKCSKSRLVSLTNRVLCLLATCLILGVAQHAQGETFELVPSSAVWRYNHSGEDLHTAWSTPGFDDTQWPSGRAQLGYGDGDEQTSIPSSPVLPCYYFRHSFTINSPAVFESLSLEVLRDDGCIVYLNGQEVARYNMPAAAVGYGTWASSAGEYSWDAPKTIPNLLVTGNNVLAVEVHQSSTASTDLSFDLRLTGSSSVSVALGYPADGASSVAAPVTLTAQAIDPEGQPLSVSFYGRNAPPPVPDFTIAVLPDTQFYTDEVNGGNIEMFKRQTQWIVENRTYQNIAYVAHVGDISNNGDRYVDEWINANAAINTLTAAGMPFGLAVGNHDQIVATGDTQPTTFFNQYFGLSQFASRDYYGGSYSSANNNNHYDLFTASGLDFIVIYFEFDSTPDEYVLQWADALLETHGTRQAIVVTHYLLETTAAWGVQGQAIYDRLKAHPNLFLMLCGHNHGEAQRTDAFMGNTVHTLLADYQDYPNGGSGYMRLLEFSPSRNTMKVQTFSPWLNTSLTDSDSEFTLGLPLMGGPAFELVHQNVGVTSGTTSTATWEGLLPGKDYEWLVVASDGTQAKTSEVRRFTTTSSAAPTVFLSSPQTGANYADSTAYVKITADANDSDGTIAQVEFYAGATSLGVSTGAPYEVTAEFQTGVYSLTAVATDNSGVKSRSSAVQFTVGSTPVAPMDLGASAISRSAVEVTWADVSNNESGFDLYQSLQDGGEFVLAKTLPADSRSTSLEHLRPGTTYYYFVRAFNSLGYADSAVVTAATFVNNTPVASPDSYSMLEDKVLIVPVPGLAANDVDHDGDALATSLLSPPGFGTVLLDTDGSFSYSPSSNFNGTDTFIYRVDDGFNTSEAQVTVIVSAENDIPNAVADVARTLAGVSVVVTVLANDLDPDSSILTVSALTPGANGTTILNPDGTITYKPRAGFTGVDTFAYSISDGEHEASASVTVTVDPNVIFQDGFETGSFGPGAWGVSGSATVEYAAANAGSYGANLKRVASITKNLPSVPTTTVNLSYSRRVSGLQSNQFGWVEVSSDGQTWILVERITGTTAWERKDFQIVATGGLYLRFRINGADSKDIFMVDEVVVSAGVDNSLPLALEDSYQLDEDGLLSVAAPGVLGNDSDDDGDALSATLVMGPAKGSLDLAVDGSFTYIPNRDASGADSFIYRAGDGLGVSAETTVNIAIASVNDAPVASNDFGTTDVGSPVTIRVLDNDSDPESDALSLLITVSSVHGSLSINADQTITYTPAQGYTGPDSFIYEVSDGHGGTSQAIVTLNVEARAVQRMHISSIVVLAQDAGKGVKRGQAEVTIVDALGNPVSGAIVSGAFSAGIAEALTRTTGENGKAIFETTGTVSNRNARFRFDVTNVEQPGWTYDLPANVETWDDNY